jgi:hypothetical protein
MAEPLAKAAPAAAPKPCFTVSQNDVGDWIARERHSAIVRVFPTQKAAVHFALFELGNRPATALLTPRSAEPRAWFAR